MATKKAAGSTSLGRDSAGKRLGVKLSDGQWAKTGMIIIRQRGTKYRPGLNVKKGKDDTLFAMTNGFVKFTTKKLKKFTGALEYSKMVSIVKELNGQTAPSEASLKKTPLKKGKTAKTTVKKTKLRYNVARKEKLEKRAARKAVKK